MTEQKNSISSTDLTVKLAPPGAGLPFFQRVFIQFFVLPRRRASLQPLKSLGVFQKTRNKILERTSDLSAAEISKRVLVAPIPGLEDSSRYWSVAMTLEHLNIVSGGIEKMVFELVGGLIPSFEIRTADVKPRALSEMEAVEFLNKYSDESLRIHSKLTEYFSGNFLQDTLAQKNFYGNGFLKKHPWFGPMSAAQWLWLLGVHQGIHLEQVRRILKG